jgi:hypothetical protein
MDTHCPPVMVNTQEHKIIVIVYPRSHGLIIDAGVIVRQEFEIYLVHHGEFHDFVVCF